MPQVQIGFLVLYGIVSLIGTLGNIFILITVIRSQCVLLCILLFTYGLFVKLLRLSRPLIWIFLCWLLLQIFTKPITNFALQFPRTPDLHTGFNLFICNMAVSDVVMCITAAPLTPVTSFTGRWFLGQVPCIILPACQV